MINGISQRALVYRDGAMAVAICNSERIQFRSLLILTGISSLVISGCELLLHP